MKHTKLKPWYKKPVEFTKADKIDITVAKATATIAVSSAQTADAKAVSAQSAAQSADTRARSAQSSVQSVQSAVKKKADISDVNRAALNSWWGDDTSTGCSDAVFIPQPNSSSVGLTPVSYGTCVNQLTLSSEISIPCNLAQLVFKESGVQIYFIPLFTSRDGLSRYWYDPNYDQWVAARGYISHSTSSTVGKFIVQWMFISTLKGHYIYKLGTGHEGKWYSMNGDTFAYPTYLETNIGDVRNKLCDLGSKLPMRYRYVMQLRTDQISAGGYTGGNDTLRDSMPVLKGYSRQFIAGDLGKSQRSSSVATHIRRETIGGIYDAIADCGGYHIFASSPGSGSDAVTNNNQSDKSSEAFTAVQGVNKFYMENSLPEANSVFIYNKSGEPFILNEGAGFHLKIDKFTSIASFIAELTSNLSPEGIHYCQTHKRMDTTTAEGLLTSIAATSVSNDLFGCLSTEALTYSGNWIVPLYWACVVYQHKQLGESSSTGTQIFRQECQEDTLKGVFMDPTSTDLWKHFLYYNTSGVFRSGFKPVAIPVSEITGTISASGEQTKIDLTIATIPIGSWLVIGPYHD